MDTSTPPALPPPPTGSPSRTRPRRVGTATVAFTWGQGWQPSDGHIHDAWSKARGQGVRIAGPITRVANVALVPVVYGPVHGNAPSDYSRKARNAAYLLDADQAVVLGLRREDA